MIDRKRTNLVLITCHDLGRYLGCYGIETVRTPNLDAMAKSGVQFTQAFACAPQCSPARAAMTTGRHPHATGVLGLTHGRFAWDLTEDQLTLPQHLASQGYHTVLAGLQHETNRTSRLGFDQRIAPCPGPEFVGVSCSDIASGACEFFSQQTRESKPFFMQVGFFEPHRDPASSTGFTPGILDGDQDVILPSYVQDTPEVRMEFAHFQAAVQLVDQAVGKMLASINQAGLADNTLVVFTADHGMPFPRAKCTLYDAGLEVPLLMAGTNFSMTQASQYDGLFSMIDLYPTLCHMLGLPIPTQVQGISHVDAMVGDTPPQEVIFSQMTFHDYYDPLRSIRTEDYKLIVSFEATRSWMDPTQQWHHHSAIHPTLEKPGLRHPPIRLFDLKKDPNEFNNLADDPAYVHVRKTLSEQLLAWMQKTSDPILHGMPLSPAHRQAMSELLTDSMMPSDRQTISNHQEVTS